MIKKQSINFLSENSKLAGSLYFPEAIEHHMAPALLLCQGFGATKEMLLPRYAEKFAASGYVVMTFDYSGFGGSEGETGRIVPKRQVADIKNAVTYLSSLGVVDTSRIGLWGTSYGGANAIVAASSDTRVKCLAVQVTFGDGKRCIAHGRANEELERLIETLQKMQARKEETGKEMLVPIEKILSDEQSLAFLEKYAKEFPELKIKVPFLTILETINYKPEEYLKNLHAPIFIVGAEKDGVNPITETYSLYAMASDPKDLMIVKDATHFELYEGKFFEEVSTRQLAWFDKYLKV